MLVPSPLAKMEEPVNLDLQKKDITACVLLDSWVATVEMVRNNDGIYFKLIPSSRAPKVHQSELQQS